MTQLSARNLPAKAVPTNHRRTRDTNRIEVCASVAVHNKGTTAQSLNDHYAAISSDIHNRPALRLLAVRSRSFFLHFGQTSTNGLPAWFLRLAEMFKKSVAEGVIPREWKAAVIIPKISKPANPSDFRSKSITSVLSLPLQTCIIRSMFTQHSILRLVLPTSLLSDRLTQQPLLSSLSSIKHIHYSPCWGIGGTVKREKGRGGY